MKVIDSDLMDEAIAAGAVPPELRTQLIEAGGNVLADFVALQIRARTQAEVQRAGFDMVQHLTKLGHPEAWAIDKAFKRFRPAILNEAAFRRECKHLSGSRRKNSAGSLKRLARRVIDDEQESNSTAESTNVND